MRRQTADARMIAALCFRLLPVQVLLAGIGAVNGIVSSLFASNSVGAQAMSAVALYAPVNMFVGAVSTMLVGGSQILCGRYMGENHLDRTQGVFSLDLALSSLFSLALIALLVLFGAGNLTGFLTGGDEAVRRCFNQYLLGMAIGVLPMLLGQQLSAFLSLENRMRRTLLASLAYIAANLLLNYLFVVLLHMEAFGLALASSLGLWVFFAVQAQYYTTEKALLRFRVRGLRRRELRDILRIGAPGAMSYGYQTLRGFLLNALILQFVGSVGVSAFGVCNAFLALFWAIPAGMLAVSRMLFSVSTGEEDRQTLQDIMRVMFTRHVPLMAAVAAALALCAVPFARFYWEAAAPEFMLTVRGFRILPLCMPLSVIMMHFVCYGQISGKQVLIHLLSVLDGVVCVVGFSALLIPVLGMDSVYVANVFNGVVTTIVIFAYAWILNRRFPRRIDELMVIPADFGAAAEERMDLTVRSTEEVVDISQRFQAFCRERGVDDRRACLAGLFLEEMAGNVVDHGFTKDKKKHSVDIRAVCKDERVILRIRDDCVPFDPAQRQRAAVPEDAAGNIGIRMVYRIARDIQYQNILGLNVLTIQI